MDNYKVIHVKFDDINILLEKMKEIMETYDMVLASVDENKYTFDRDGIYSRAFIINIGINGWITIYDQDETQIEQFAMEMSELLSTSIIYVGVLKDLFYYNLYDNGHQMDKYLSSFEYYEYEVNDNIMEAYKGNANMFENLIKVENMNEFQETLDECKSGLKTPRQSYELMVRLLEIVPNEELIEEHEDDDEEEEGEEVIISPEDIFYVDFESINIMTDDKERVLNVIEEIVNELGFKMVEDFNTQNNNKGFFKKIFSSVSESKRLRFFVSPVSNGWVTLVGEIETMLGETPAEWKFIHIEEKLSQVLLKPVINIFADNEGFGFKVFKDGWLVYEYNSNDEIVDDKNIQNIVPNVETAKINKVLSKPINTVEDIDFVFGELCGMLKISNYKINIPMDYSQEEFYRNIINTLPDGSGFIELKFVEKK